MMIIMINDQLLSIFQTKVYMSEYWFFPTKTFSCQTSDLQAEMSQRKPTRLLNTVVGGCQLTRRS